MPKRFPRQPLFLAVAVSMVFALSASAAPKRMALATGDRAPQIRGNTTTGERVIPDYTKSKVTLVNFWATWCAPCLEEMPMLDRLYREFRDDLNIVGVLHEAIDDQALATFVEERGVIYPLIRPWRRYTADWGGMALLPMTFMVDQQGKVVRRYVGASADQIVAMEEDIRAQLAGRPLAAMVIPEETTAVSDQDRRELLKRQQQQPE